MTFVDGLGVGDISDVALRDRRHMSEDGVLIVVTTLSNGRRRAARADRARVRRVGGAASPRCARRRTRSSASSSSEDIREIKLIQEHLHDGIGQLVYDRTRRRPMILPVVVEV